MVPCGDWCVFFFFNVIDEIYLFGKDSFQSKYQLFINGREKVRLEKLKSPKAFND